MSTFSMCQQKNKGRKRKTDRCLEYHKYVRLVMSIKRLAFSTEVFRAICATVPCPLDALHTAIA